MDGTAISLLHFNDFGRQEKQQKPGALEKHQSAGQLSQTGDAAFISNSMIRLKETRQAGKPKNPISSPILCLLLRNSKQTKHDQWQTEKPPPSQYRMPA
ncbi:hypothetical protein [Synechococcus sp. BIOS-E4-1]|uniref:hypothetical protein n=1 Tax=Synechococcus sp. BIOS-E4-1 TaxID=1400864 RepID=UPI001646B955|nr:hypothetical protein [Synechococcus sp. BIOS-E4-1]